MHFHTDDETTISWLGSVLHRAKENNLPIRLDVTDDGSLMVKLGGGMWTAPISGTPDLNRDTAPSRVIPIGRKS